MKYIGESSSAIKLRIFNLTWRAEERKVTKRSAATDGYYVQNFLWYLQNYPRVMRKAIPLREVKGQ